MALVLLLAALIVLLAPDAALHGSHASPTLPTACTQHFRKQLQIIGNEGDVGSRPAGQSDSLQHATARNSAAQLQTTQAQTLANWQAGKAEQVSEAERQRWLALQGQLLSDELIHSPLPFQPHLHVGNLSSLAPIACACPLVSPAAYADLQELSAASHATSEPLPVPRCMAAPDAHTGAHSDALLLGEVYVANLAERADRVHYICAVLRHLRLPAVLWPAFPK